MWFGGHEKQSNHAFCSVAMAEMPLKGVWLHLYQSALFFQKARFTPAGSLERDLVRFTLFLANSSAQVTMELSL